MPRNRNPIEDEPETQVRTEGEVVMSELFTPLTADEWKEQGGGGSAERGLYTNVLVAFKDSGQKYAVISMARGRFAGKKASSISTALKNAADSKNAPEGLGVVKISSRGENAEKGIEGAVFLENTSIED